MIGFFSNRTHQTRFNLSSSGFRSIFASVIQGSALGLAAFILNASDLHHLISNYHFVKYADDVFLVVTSRNSSSICDKILHLSVLSKASRWELTGGNTPYSLKDLPAQSNKTLFSSVFNNPLHVFRQFLPPPTTHSHNLRTRSHHFSLPKSSTLRSHNFIHRMLIKDIF